jgi:glycosyltransferase involved in cell wall biosynthesis
MNKNGKSHILFYAPTPPPYAGPEVATNLLLEAFENNKIELLHVRSNVRNENAKKGIFDIEGITSFLKVYKNFLHQLRKIKPDKVYFLLSSGKIGFLRDAIIVFTTKLLHRKTVAHYRGGNFHNFYKQQRLIFQWFIRQTLKNIDCLIVQAEILKNIFNGLVDRNKIRVLYNGLPFEKDGSRTNPATVISSAGFRTSNETVRNNLKCGIDHNINYNKKRSFTILFIGHIAFSKGFYELVLAYLRLRRKYNVRLLFAGEKRFSGNNRKSVISFLSGESKKFFLEHTEHIENFINEFILYANNYGAQYLGIITEEEKKKVFTETDVFVLPSYTEGFSMSVLEAMASGLPVVVTPVGALTEIVSEGKSGLFVKIGDSEDIESKIEQLITNPELARTMGKNNKEYVHQTFNIKDIAEQLETILAEI